LLVESRELHVDAGELEQLLQPDGHAGTSVR
jgi:hypothetical protein